MSPPLLPKRAPDGGRIQCLPPQGAGAWASLPDDLVELIGWRVLTSDLLDYVRFRAVCTHWTSSTMCPRGRGLIDPRFHPCRWMMLPEGDGLYPGHPDLGGHVRFFNLSTGTFVRVHLPLLDDHGVLESADGLLLLVRHCDRSTAIRLLHPFTGDIAELPPLSSALPHRDLSDDLRFLLSGICAAITVTTGGVITVMLAPPLNMMRNGRIAHAAVGDHCWTLSSWEFPGFLTSTMAFHGKLYRALEKPLGKKGVCIYQIDPPQPSSEDFQSLPLQPPRIVAECPLLGIMGKVSLVECGSELMVVGFLEPSCSHFVVYRVADLTVGRVASVTDIGEHALFLGQRNLCVSCNGLPSIPGNSVTSDFKPTNWQPGMGGQSIEHYHLGSGTWSRATNEGVLNYEKTLARPYMLIHHIYTCCHRLYWNKGLMVRERTRPDWSNKPNLWAGGGAEVVTRRVREGTASAYSQRSTRKRARMEGRGG